MNSRKVPTSITRALLGYHKGGEWLSSLQLCSFLNDQRIRLCPEHLFLASDVIHTNRPDLSEDFLRTFCTSEQQPSLVGLLEAPMAGSWRAKVVGNYSLLPVDYMCENIHHVSNHRHHGDGLRLVRNCIQHDDLMRLFCQRLQDRPEGYIVLSSGMSLLSRACADALSASVDGNAREDAVIADAVDNYCHVIRFVERLSNASHAATATATAVIPQSSLTALQPMEAIPNEMQIVLEKLPRGSWLSSVHSHAPHSDFLSRLCQDTKL